MLNLISRLTYCVCGGNEPEVCVCVFLPRFIPLLPSGNSSVLSECVRVMCDVCVCVRCVCVCVGGVFIECVCAQCACTMCLLRVCVCSGCVFSVCLMHIRPSGTSEC